MRVTLCVDALEPQSGGIGRYTEELWKGLSQRSEITDLHYYAGRRLITDPHRLRRGDRVRRGRGLGRAWRSFLAVRALRSTLVHSPNYFLPAAARTGVITVHDLSVFRFPESHPAERIKDFERRFTDSLRRAVHVITDSETVRDEILAGFLLDPSSVTAVSLGVDERFVPGAGERFAPVLKSWGLAPGEYGLCVSTFEPRKRIGNLILAWRDLPLDVRRRYPLVLAGGSGWQNAALRDQIASAEGEGWLRHLGFVDEQLLPALYAGAALFIYPSIYEGFGLPPLEAMASGIPTVVSNKSCMPEVCGDAPMFVDPEDIERMREAIERALVDAAWRKGAVSRGLKQARTFRWDRCIEETISVYKGVFESSPLTRSALTDRR